MSNYEYPNKTPSFGTTKAGTDNLRRERDEEYRDRIPFILYNAMLNYKIEIGD
jgi:hypothetical protein